MKVLITGSEGFVGSETKRLFQSKGIDVFPYDLMFGYDIRDEEQLDLICSDYSPDVVLHLAAIARFSDADRDPYLAHEINVEGTKNVVNICKKLHIPLVYASTGSVYMPIKEEPPIIEEFKTSGNSIYGCTKLLGEKYVEQHCPYIILRYAHLYGPEKRGHGLIGGYWDRIKRGLKPKLFGGCLPPGEKVVTDVDLKNIEDIKIGDFVYSSIGEYQKVIDVFSRDFDGDIYNVKSIGNYDFKLTPEHKVKICRLNTVCHTCVNKDILWVKVKDINVDSDFLLLPRHKVNNDNNINMKLFYPKGVEWFSDNNYIYVPIKSIEIEKYNGKVYNIETEDNTYCVPYIIHNSQSNDFAYIKDIAKANYLAVTSPWDRWQQIYNIGTGQELSAKEAGDIICNLLGWEKGVEELEGRTVDPERFVYSIEKARVWLGFDPDYDFRKGLEDMFSDEIKKHSQRRERHDK